MKKLSKGFTLVELVIVIAVIGILSAILIPTFTSVIESAKATAAAAEADSAKKLLFVCTGGASTEGTIIVHTNGCVYLVKDNALTLIGELESLSVSGTTYTKITNSELSELSENVTVYTPLSLNGSSLSKGSLEVEGNSISFVSNQSLSNETSDLVNPTDDEPAVEEPIVEEPAVEEPTGGETTSETSTGEETGDGQTETQQHETPTGVIALFNNGTINLGTNIYNNLYIYWDNNEYNECCVQICEAETNNDGTVDYKVVLDKINNEPIVVGKYSKAISNEYEDDDNKIHLDNDIINTLLGGSNKKIFCIRIYFPASGVIGASNLSEVTLYNKIVVNA